MPDDDAPRKPRRLGLWLPFGLALAAAVAWSGFWLFARSGLESGMDAGVAQLKQAGYEVSWKARRIYGYPFRLDVSLTEPRIREPGGWGLEAPRLEAEAYLHAPTHWIAAAPDGLTFIRPLGGPVTVTGKRIRAGLSDITKAPPSFDFEGVDLVFAPGAGAQPFGLTAAKTVEFHLRSGPDDKGLVTFRVDDGAARLSGLFARIAGERPVQLEWESELSTMSAMKGPDWPSAVRAWTAAGGRILVRKAGVTAGEAVVGARAGTLTVGHDGRLRGALDVTLRQAPLALSALGETGVIPPETAMAAAAVAAARAAAGDTAQATITFEAGLMTLGPVAIGAAPRVY